jgi:dipeptidyl aminopeptidase/acylaminoacyl peptidase
MHHGFGVRIQRTAACATLLSAALLVAAPPLAAQRPTLTPADYGRWETLGTTELSQDGEWLAYTVNRVDGDVELRIRHVREDNGFAVPHGAAPAFSMDGRWLAYSLGVSRAERDQREAAGETVHSRVALLDLVSGATTDLGPGPSFAFSGDGAYIAVRAYADSAGGAALAVHDLLHGGAVHFGSTTAHAWRDRGAVLALITRADADHGSSALIYDAASGTLRPLAADSSGYTGLIWRPDADDVALLRVRRDEAFEQPTHAIMLWQNASTVRPRAAVLDPSASTSFPEDQRVVDMRALRWSDDGRTIFFGVRERTPRSSDSTQTAASRADVEIWHSADVDIVPEQKVQAGLDLSGSHVAAWTPATGRVVAIGSAEFENVVLSDGRYAVALDGSRYARERMFGPPLRDIYTINVTTGERMLVAERVQHQFGISPGGRYVLYVRAGHYWTFDTRTRRHTNITERVPTSFINERHDYALPEKPPFGTGGWTVGDRSVLLHDRYDVWDVASDGSRARNLTNGAAERIRHRRIWLDPDQRVVDFSGPVFVALQGETTKQTGFGRIRPDAAVERLVLTDAQLSRLSKARHADVYMYRVERFDDSPDMFVGSAMLDDARQVTRTNPFMDEYAWGRAELLDFTSVAGRELQAALFYPADHEPGRTYPLIVDIYEVVSSSLHTFAVPSEYTQHNTTTFTQNGYFVLRPDIAYRLRDPGVSAVEAVVPAVQRALATGLIDPDRIGLIGHSWGAYQTAFAITQTDLFRAAVAAAPIANMVSMYLSVYWNTGGTDARMFEIDQGRMEVPFWEDLDAYVRNSPVFHIERMNTPLLVAFGNRDGAVDWHQGLELYNAARRAGKDLVLLVYEGENHSLARRPNQLDYHRRTNEWFAHYLKGERAPDWIRSGVPHRDRVRELERIRAGTDQGRFEGRQH